MILNTFKKLLCCAPPRCCIEVEVIEHNNLHKDIRLKNKSGAIDITHGDAILLKNYLIDLYKNYDNSGNHIYHKK